MDTILFGAAYYDEYMPYDRLAEDIAMMRRAGFTTVRIAESTWSTLQPAPDTFDFSHIDCVLDAMAVNGIGVIVGTPTYAVPPWLVRLDPDVMVTTAAGRAHYGHRQRMDITNPTFLTHAERVCRALLAHTAPHPAVIGFQVDNETKYYDVAGEQVQQRFKASLQDRFGTVEALNRTFGLAYWSNALGSWDDFPDMRGCIHAGLATTFDRFRRELVTEYLAWQAALVEAYRRPEQFITHNFDYEWHKFGADIAQDGWSYGVQPQVDHWAASKPMMVAGVDIYHPTQHALTGAEIAFGGDVSRCLKQQPYLVLETQAQGFKEWLPFPGQLRLHAFSHLASGAAGVMYWNWHSIHNGYETYWKGLLSHDFAPNPTYEEAVRLGAELARMGPEAVIARKRNRVALLVSNDALSLLNWFPVDRELSYNDIVRWVYDTLYRMNVECDILPAEEAALDGYDLIVLPALYCASEALLSRLLAYVERGGHLLATFRTAVCDLNGTVYPDTLPHRLHDCFVMWYNQHTAPSGTRLTVQPAMIRSAGSWSFYSRRLPKCSMATATAHGRRMPPSRATDTAMGRPPTSARPSARRRCATSVLVRLPTPAFPALTRSGR